MTSGPPCSTFSARGKSLQPHRRLGLPLYRRGAGSGSGSTRGLDGAGRASKIGYALRSQSPLVSLERISEAPRRICHATRGEFELQNPNAPRAKSVGLAKSDAVRRILYLPANSNTPGKNAETFPDCLPKSPYRTPL